MDSSQLSKGAILQGGKYRIESVLGQGGFGITYLATQELLDRKVAVKEFFMRDFCSREGDTSSVTLGTASNRETMERYLNKFLKEARTIAALTHPNIIQIHDIFKENNTAYYVMEYIEGESLSQLVKHRGALPESEAVKYIRAVAEALKYVHERKINHLDVKPGNIMLRHADNRVFLLDFGLSKQYDAEGNQTSSTPVGISHGYAPIEQYKPGGVKEFSPQTDIYALGATLYYLVTGIVPPSATDLLETELDYPETLSASVCNAIRQAMKVQKKERPKDIDTFLALLNGEVQADKQADPETEVGVKSVDIPVSQIEDKPTMKKRKNGLFLLAFLLVVVIGLVVWNFSGRSSGDGNASDSLQIAITENLQTDSLNTEQPISPSSDNSVVTEINAPESSSSPQEQLATNLPSEVNNETHEEMITEVSNLTPNKKLEKEDELTKLKRAAENGDAEAQNDLGVRYHNGQGVAKDYTEAMKWYRKAAEQGNIVAQYNLAVMYYNGQGVAKDYSEAVKWYRKAAEQGLAQAQNDLGVRYYNGQGVAKDYAEAMKWYRKAAEQGYAMAQNNLGVMYENGRGVPQDYSEALKWYRKAAAQGNENAKKAVNRLSSKKPEKKEDVEVTKLKRAAENGNAKAQYDLGVRYYNGGGVSQNYAEAIKWYRKAAEQGYAMAQNKLGIMYEKGRGVPQDYLEAVKWYRKAAEQGDMNAQYNLGYMYEYGKGVTPDKAEAKKWYQNVAKQGSEDAKKALRRLSRWKPGKGEDKLTQLKRDAENGDAEAQYQLGFNYFHGYDGVKEDHEEAVKWYRKAAEQGHVDAQILLASCYSKGEGVSLNHAEAAKWWRKAAEQGDADAQLVIGGMYEIGEGVPKDEAEAIKWYRKSAAQGNENAKAALNILGE